MPTLVERLTQSGAVRFGEFVLTSGATSRYYIDAKRALCDPATLRAAAQEASSVSAKHGPFDAVAGMELGAVPLATAVGLEAGLPILLVRKAPRGHGTARRVEGGVAADRRVLLVEDVTTTGGSTVEAVRVLREEGAVVAHAVTVVDRGQRAAEALAAVGVTLHALVTADALLDTPEAREALA